MPSFDLTRSARTVILGAFALLLGSCTLPNFEGAQIQNPPAGFLIQNESYQNRRMFPDLPVVDHMAWIEAGNGPYSGIYINSHAGEITLEEVMAAREAGMAAAEHPATGFGEVESMTIDGRSAWGWSERLETPQLGLDWVAYRTVVTYDTISYAIEFYSGDPGIKIAAPDTLKTVLASFAIGRVDWNVPLIAVLLGGTLLLISVLRTRAAERKERLDSIKLVKFETPKEEGDGGDGTEAPTAQATTAAQGPPDRPAAPPNQPPQPPAQASTTPAGPPATPEPPDAT